MIAQLFGVCILTTVFAGKQYSFFLFIFLSIYLFIYFDFLYYLCFSSINHSSRSEKYGPCFNVEIYQHIINYCEKEEELLGAISPLFFHNVFNIPLT